MFGILNLYKPRGWTSREAVNRVQSLAARVKAGHAGTLDPLASGVLVVCLGPATRLIPYVQRMPKTYRATFLLGRRSASDDVETTVAELSAAPHPDQEAIAAALPRFLGDIWQRPPAYSAKKVAGKRAYALARAGEAVSLPANQVRVERLTIENYAYPALELEIVCGAGLYVRSLGRDVAEALGTSAVMSALERTAIGRYTADQAISVDRLDHATLAAEILPPITALQDVPKLFLSASQLEHVRNGRPVDDLPGPPGDYAAIDSQGHLAALVRRDAGGQVRPMRNFPQPT